METGNLVKDQGSMHFWNVYMKWGVNELVLYTDELSLLCVHPSERVRRGLLAAAHGLLQKCSYTLKDNRIMFLECLCTLVRDDFEEVSWPAQEFLESLFSSSKKQMIEDVAAELFSR